MLVVFILAYTFTFAQTNTEKIKAKWVVEKFEAEKNTSEANQAKQELLGVYLTFDKEELTISRKTETCDSVIKKGPYLISGNSLTIGKGRADILLLSDNRLTIKIPKQGILYLVKL